jgi:hypothetical protein
MKPMNVPTWLPLFSGFYGTIWETDADEEREIESINDIRREKGLTDVEWDAIEWDHPEYQRGVVKGVTNAVGDELVRMQLIDGYKLEQLSSPREYNFANDVIHVLVSVTAKNRRAMGTYLEANKEAFIVYLKDTYTSYDGFFSSYSNQAEDWLFDLDATLAHGHQLGAVLQFILKNDDQISEERIQEDLSGNGVTLYAKNYDALTENGQKAAL